MEIEILVNILFAMIDELNGVQFLSLCSSGKLIQCPEKLKSIEITKMLFLQYGKHIDKFSSGHSST